MVEVKRGSYVRTATLEGVGRALTPRVPRVAHRQTLRWRQDALPRPPHWHPVDGKHFGGTDSRLQSTPALQIARVPPFDPLLTTVPLVAGASKYLRSPGQLQAGARPTLIVDSPTGGMRQPV